MARPGNLLLEGVSGGSRCQLQIDRVLLRRRQDNTLLIHLIRRYRNGFVR